MKRKLWIIPIVFLIFAIGRADQGKSTKVMNYLAVMDLRCGAGVNSEYAAALTEVIIDEMVKVKKYTIIDRANRDKILGEVGFQQSGCSDASCSVEAGRMLGVGKLIVGSITKIGDTYLVNLQLINVETGAVEASARETCKCDLDGLINTVAAVTHKLIGDTTSEGSSAPGAAQAGDMVYVSSGYFQMGCNSAVDNQCEDDEKPYHKVSLDSFYIDKHEVTVEQYGACVQGGKCKTPTSDGYCNFGDPRRNGNPMNCVDWSQAKAYCEWSGKRLPTEAEWEKAARGTDGRKYPWGNMPIGSAKFGNFADESGKRMFTNWKNFVEDYDDGFALTAPVGSFPAGASPYGALDMAGNVWEWVYDWYDANYYSASPEKNPPGPAAGQMRGLRGGSWSSSPKENRVSFRNKAAPLSRVDNVGFRCAKSP